MSRFRLLSVLLAALVLTWRPAEAQLVPHEATYRITLGSDPKAPEVGRAFQRIVQGCQRWQFDRDIEVSVALTRTLRYDISSSLRGEEARDGSAFDYRLTRDVNGRRSEQRGRVALLPQGGRAELITPGGPALVTLPEDTRAPVAALRFLLNQLAKGTGRYTLPTWDAEATGDVMMVTVSPFPEASITPAIPAGLPPEADALLRGTHWPIHLSFSRAEGGSPLFVTDAVLHESGILSRMAVSAGLLRLGVTLTELKPLSKPRC